MSTLTDKQELFCIEYLKDFNATQASIRAGYSAKTAYSIGSENLTKPEIQERLGALIQERKERVKIDADYVLSQAVKLHERCMQEVKPLYDRKGNHITDEDGHPLYVFDAMGAKASLELIGKHIDVSAFKERVELTGKDGEALTINITPRTEEEKSKATATKDNLEKLKENLGG